MNLNPRCCPWLTHPFTEVTLRIVLGVVLLWAGFIKATDLNQTAQGIINYQLIPEAWAITLAPLLPAVEILVGSCLILGVLFDGAVLITTGMFALFWVAVVSALARGLDIECGCFGTVDAAQIGWTTLARNTALLLGTVPLWFSNAQSWRLEGWFASNNQSPSDDPPAASAPSNERVQEG